MVDRYGRRAIDLRVSLTDRCSLRCSYCMPPEGLPWLPKDEILTDDEIIRLVRIARPLRQAGLDRVNVSLDTLDEERFNQIAYRRRLPDVLKGLSAATQAGLNPVKINSVLLR